MNQEQQLAARMGVRVRKARVAAVMTQKELAARAGIGLNRLGDMERGKSTTSLESWLKVSRVLGLLDTWENVLTVREDPFAEYDRRMTGQNDLLKTRVRKKSK